MSVIAFAISRRSNPSTKRLVSGLTLVEILVTVLVTSIGLLGMAALHLTSLRNNYDSTIRTQANILGDDIADRMRTNRTAALGGEYNIAIGNTYATPTSQAQTDISEWKKTLAQLLPSGDGSVQVDGATNIATITISWTERGTAAAIDFTTTTEL